MKYFFIFISFLFSTVIYSQSIPFYFVSATDHYYFPLLLNLIGSIHRLHINDLAEFAVFDLGMEQKEKELLQQLKKVKVYQLEKTNPDILKRFNTGFRTVPGWYAFKPVCIKQALDRVPYVLWLDAGTVVLKSLESLFTYILQQGYFLCTIGDGRDATGKFMHDARWCTTKLIRQKFNLDTPENNWILDQEPTMGGIIGASRQPFFYKTFVLPIYELTRDLKNFQDDGSTPNGFGTARHDQPIYTAISRLNNMTVHVQDYTQEKPMQLMVDGINREFYITWHKSSVSAKTHIYSSRGDMLAFYQYIVTN